MQSWIVLYFGNRVSEEEFRVYFRGYEDRLWFPKVCGRGGGVDYFFPNYCFLDIEGLKEEYVLEKIESVRSLLYLKVLGSGKKLSDRVLSSVEVDAIESLEGGKDLFCFEVGEKVKVLEGVLEGFVGVVKQCIGRKVILELVIFGRNVDIELDSRVLKKE